MSLYQIYRPQKFSSLIGQDAIKKTLSSAIAQDKVSHAYLFVGPRGTGKTSTARLVAKSLNCLKRKKGEVEPCGECSNCLEITNSHSLDVIEIDAASNRGIDEIRDLRDKIKYAPSAGKYKVFIIDEVHMLTRESFNALLKTLEEPPKHAVFIMATTEPHKVPDTILSRVQEFDFKRASLKEIILDLKNIIKSEKINIEESAIELIANRAQGSFRDGESTLDKVLSLDSKKITYEDVQQILGIVKDNVIGDFIEYIFKKDIKGAITILNNTYENGYDLKEFNNQIITYLRVVMLCKNGLEIKNMISEGEEKRLKKLSNEISYGKILKMIESFIGAKSQFKNSEIAELPIELVIYDLIEVNERVEIEVENKELINKNNKVQKVENKKEDKKEEIKEEKEVKVEQEKKHEDTKEVKLKKQTGNKEFDFVSNWDNFVKVVASKNHSLNLLLKDSKPVGFSDGAAIIGVKFKFYEDRIKNTKNYEILTCALEEVAGEKYPIKCEITDVTKVKAKKKKTSSESSGDLLTDAMDVFDM